MFTRLLAPFVLMIPLQWFAVWSSLLRGVTDLDERVLMGRGILGKAKVLPGHKASRIHMEFMQAAFTNQQIIEHYTPLIADESLAFLDRAVEQDRRSKKAGWQSGGGDRERTKLA